MEKIEPLELYAYATPSDLEKGRVKVGHTKIGGHRDRIRQQFGTSNAEYPEYILVGELPLGKRDHHVHAQLIKNGIRKVEHSPGKEFFYATFDDVKRAYNEIVYGSHRRDNYKLRDEQKQAVERAKKWFLKEYSDEVIRGATYPNRFLINAKMRFGKCFTSLHLAKALNAKRVLVVTYKPDVIGEWLDAVNEHVDFEGWVGIRAKAKSKISIDPCLDTHSDFHIYDNPILLCVSLQDLWIDKYGNTKERLQKIPRIRWDLIIFDEVHYGSRTERASYILNQLNYKYRLDLSGTPFKLIEFDDFCAQQVFTYSYIDEQEKKKEEIASDPQDIKEKIYRLMPNLNISAIEITEKDIAEQRDTFETDDIDFSLNKLFQTDEAGRFSFNDAVDHFIDGLTRSDHSARSISVFGKLAQKLNCPPKRHTVWWLRRVDSIKALINKLHVHPYFSNFVLIDASGSDTAKSENERIIVREKSKVEQAIKDVNNTPNKLGTITLTCGRFLTGVTIKEWDSILVLNDTQSAESYFQAIFRVQSRWISEKTHEIIKPTAWVFDFAISRCLTVTYDCASNIADQLASYEGTNSNDNNLDIITQKLCDTLDIKRFYEGDLVSTPTTAKDIFEVLNHEGSKIALARRITSDFLVNFAQLKFVDNRLLEILGKIKGYRTQNVADISAEKLVQIGIDAERLNEIKSDPNLASEVKEEIIEGFCERDEDKERKTYKRWYATQIKRLAICMADFIYMTYERETNISDVIETKSPQFFEVMTGISKDDFSELCNKGFIKTSPLNRIVREFKDQETTSLNPEEYILMNIIPLVSVGSLSRTNISDN
ncbi:Type III restriction enzyme, res subunit [Legionella beliardensis]|uniref:Type III restriction enzyme, res subunit n=1 Tax=Legionella beliardensis TaxID=91822 RepID=A0A378I0F3_9GAMM|nr:DEAD/DEAH box helicase family protein [Legionella beliardensis]STX28452.1 Type III restriction enzyme, res subunit [Legionella beliardensis]